MLPGELKLVDKIMAQEGAGDPVRMGHHGLLGGRLGNAGDMGQGSDQRIGDGDCLMVGRRLADPGDVIQLVGPGLVALEQ